MTEQTRTQQATQQTGPNGRPVKHVHHGRTPAAWAGTMITLVAFIVGAIGLVVGNWVIFWIAAAMIVIALVVTVVMRKMGLGAD